MGSPVARDSVVVGRAFRDCLGFRSSGEQQVPRLRPKRAALGMTVQERMRAAHRMTILGRTLDAAPKRRSTLPPIGVPRLRPKRAPLGMTDQRRMRAPLGVTIAWVELAFRPASKPRHRSLPLCRRPARSPPGRSAIGKQQVPPLGLKPSVGMTNFWGGVGRGPEGPLYPNAAGVGNNRGPSTRAEAFAQDDTLKVNAVKVNAVSAQDDTLGINAGSAGDDNS